MFPDDTEPYNPPPRYDREATMKRMAELMIPIDQSIMLTDDHKDRLMLACAMLQRVREIFDDELGVEARMEMFRPLAKGE